MIITDIFNLFAWWPSNSDHDQHQLLSTVHGQQKKTCFIAWCNLTHLQPWLLALHTSLNGSGFWVI